MPTPRDQQVSGSPTGSQKQSKLKVKPSQDAISFEEDATAPEDGEQFPDTRLGNTTIRRGVNIGSARTTSAQPPPSPIPQRRRLQQPVPAPLTAPFVAPLQRNTTRSQSTPEKEQQKVHWLLYIGVGMLVMLVLWVIGSSVLAWSLARYDDYRYGNPRTFQIDAPVGHGGDSQAHPSHFIAINLHGQIIVIELPAGNQKNAISYGGPYLFEPGGDLIPVTLEFKSYNNDRKVDMVIHIQDKIIVFLNDGTKFVPPTQ